MCLGSFVLFLCTLWVLCALFFLIYIKCVFYRSKKNNNNLSDRLWWKKAKNGSYYVKTGLDLLEGGRQQLVPIKMLWNPIVPTKVGFFTWEVWWRKILTMDQLKKRGFSLANRCPLCGKAEETLEHLLIHYPKVWCMWTALFSLLGGGWVCPLLVKNRMLGWLRLPCGKKNLSFGRQFLSIRYGQSRRTQIY